MQSDEIVCDFPSNIQANLNTEKEEEKIRKLENNDKKRDSNLHQLQIFVSLL